MQRSYVLLVLRFKLSNVSGYAKRKQTKRWQITLPTVELFTNKRWSGLLLGALAALAAGAGLYWQWGGIGGGLGLGLGLLVGTLSSWLFSDP